MRKLGELNAMSIKVGDTISIYGQFTKVTHVDFLPSGNVEIETEFFNKGVYNPVAKIEIYA